MFGHSYVLVLFVQGMCLTKPTFLLFITVTALFHPSLEEPSDNDPLASLDFKTKVAIVDDFRSILHNKTVHPARYEVSVDPKKVHFHLFSRNYQTSPIAIDDSNIKVVIRKPKAVFIIHGWITAHTTLWIHEMKDAFLKVDDCNVFVVDWAAYAFLPYGLAANTVPKVGEVVANFVMKLNKVKKYPLSDFHLVGHSLGAQISGFAGQKIGTMGSKKLGRITGLDAAGPLFKNTHLSSNDAVFVDAIHTNGNVFGYNAPYGRIDFFPNGGTLQTGCLSVEVTSHIAELVQNFPTISCSHHRSILYFTESIDESKPKKTFLSKKCRSYGRYNLGYCDADNTTMGENVNSGQNGKFYLNTNPTSLYALG